jgi:hypothetical protein
MRVHERRRLVLATCITILALPAWWLIQGGASSSSDSSSVAAAAGGPPDDSLSPETPIFLDNTVVVPVPAVIDIAVPDSASPHDTPARLTFKKYDGILIPTPCSTMLAPSGAHITVVNIDNGLSVTCINTLGVSVPLGADMAIDINLYVRIADLVDAPVPVRISW